MGTDNKGKRRGAARWSRNQRSADSLVRGFLACGSGLADKAVRAPRKSSPHATMLGDSTAEAAKRRKDFSALRFSAPPRFSQSVFIRFHPWLNFLNSVSCRHERLQHEAQDHARGATDEVIPEIGNIERREAVAQKIEREYECLRDDRRPKHRRAADVFQEECHQKNPQHHAIEN